MSGTAGKLAWDAAGAHLYETGIDYGVLYPQDSSGTYTDGGYAWNGLTGVTEKPSGAEPTEIYADNIKYLNLYSLEDFGLTIEAYTYPDQFKQCIGEADMASGIGAVAGQQERKSFGLCYRTRIGNDVDGSDHGYKLHLVYGCRASTSERGYQTINDSPEAIQFSWDITTVPVTVTGMKPTSIITIDSTKANATKLKALEDKLYGKDAVAADAQNGISAADATVPYLPQPSEVVSTLS